MNVFSVAFCVQVDWCQCWPSRLRARNSRRKIQPKVSTAVFSIAHIQNYFGAKTYGLWCTHSNCFNLTMLSPALFLSAWSSPERICSDFCHPPSVCRHTVIWKLQSLLRQVLMSIPLWFISLFLWRGRDPTATLTNSGRFPKRGVPFYCEKKRMQLAGFVIFLYGCFQN